MDYRKEYEFWLQSDCFNEETKAELRAITDEKEIEDRFYKNLKFGTGGMRGIIGAGTNRMNIYTITKVTQGLANYILEVGPKACEMGVVIAHDSRIMSPEFCEATALCLNANGIKTYVFDSLRPTPELSFAVRELGCIAGIVITASHNPPEYNGLSILLDSNNSLGLCTILFCDKILFGKSTYVQYRGTGILSTRMLVSFILLFYYC